LTMSCQYDNGRFGVSNIIQLIVTLSR